MKREEGSIEMIPGEDDSKLIVIDLAKSLPKKKKEINTVCALRMPASCSKVQGFMLTPTRAYTQKNDNDSTCVRR